MTAQPHHRPQVHSGAASAASAAPRAASWPTEFPLPDGFLPEGITIGAKPYAYIRGPTAPSTAPTCAPARAGSSTRAAPAWCRSA
jgi:hypothetical protein